MSVKQSGAVYARTEAAAAAKSLIAKEFLDSRASLNAAVLSADNMLVNRFYNLDTNTYREGALTAKSKELMGLAVSSALRCEDCVKYHIIQSWRLEATRDELEETLNIALIIGGSIVVPALRRAYKLLDELYS